MSDVYKNVAESIGNTPMVFLSNIKRELNLQGNILAKLEMLNPGGSIKTRIAKQMIEDAEIEGRINKDSVLIEPTSGNTGIGIALIAAIKGMRTIFTMPETMSIERQKLLKAYGAEIVLTEGGKGMVGAIEKAEELLKTIPNSFIPSQFENPSNPKAHLETTGPEIWENTKGAIDILIAGVGTGGTITGTGLFLKGKNPNIKVIAVEPSDSPVLSKGRKGPHKIQGIGAGFFPKVLDTKVYDEVIDVEWQEAFDGARVLATTEGILGGISSGAAMAVAIEEAKKEENKGKNIVVILPDTGERYLSTDLYE